MPRGAKAEQVAAGWPSWLASVAGEAIHGWTPRSPDSYEKLNKVCPSKLLLLSLHLWLLHLLPVI